MGSALHITFLASLIKTRIHFLFNINVHPAKMMLGVLWEAFPQKSKAIEQGRKTVERLPTEFAKLVLSTYYICTYMYEYIYRYIYVMLYCSF